MSYATQSKVAEATTAGLKAVVEKYELPDEAYNVFSYYFKESLEKLEDEDVPNTSTPNE